MGSLACLKQLRVIHKGPKKKSTKDHEGARRTLRFSTKWTMSHQGHEITFRALISALSMSRSLINIDGQDIQDGLLMVWAACSRTRVFTHLSSTITFSSTRIPETSCQAHGSLQTRTRSSSESASWAAASRPVYPVYPCSLKQPTGLTGHGPCSR